MKLILAHSADGYLAREDDPDDMGWTGTYDKRIFRLLTAISGKVAAGRRSAKVLPPLPGREVLTLTRSPERVGEYNLDHPRLRQEDIWLIGGPTVAAEAIRRRLVTLVVFCECEARLGSGTLLTQVTSVLHKQRWEQVTRAGFPGVTVRVMRRLG